MDSWVELGADERQAVWAALRDRLGFDLADRKGTGLREPEHSVTYDVAHVYGDGRRYQALTSDLCDKVLAALRRCVAENGFVYATDGRRVCYRFAPHESFDYVGEDDWTVPLLPNAEFTCFADGDLQFGLFGNPWAHTICVFGTPLLMALEADPPTLFDRPVRLGGQPLTSTSRWGYVLKGAVALSLVSAAAGAIAGGVLGLSWARSGGVCGLLGLAAGILGRRWGRGRTA